MCEQCKKLFEFYFRILRLKLSHHIADCPISRISDSDLKSLFANKNVYFEIKCGCSRFWWIEAFILYTFYMIHENESMKAHWWRQKVECPRGLMFSNRTIFSTFKHAHESIQFILNVCMLRNPVHCTFPKYVF